MKLVIGGAYQGKQEAAMRLFGCARGDFLDGRTCALPDIESCRAIAHFHEYIRRCMRGADDCPAQPWMRERADGERELDADAFAGWLIRTNPDLLVVSDEIGYGVVPVGREERAWRETTGRVCCRLAEYSDTVVRVLAGIPTVIKQAGAPEEGR